MDLAFSFHFCLFFVETCWQWFWIGYLTNTKTMIKACSISLLFLLLIYNLKCLLKIHFEHTAVRGVLCTRIHICIVVRSLKKWCSRRYLSHAGHPTFHPVLSVFDTKELAKVNNKSNGCASGMPNSLWVLQEYLQRAVSSWISRCCFSGASQLSGTHQEIIENIFYYQTALKFDMRVVEELGTM